MAALTFSPSQSAAKLTDRALDSRPRAIPLKLSFPRAARGRTAIVRSSHGSQTLVDDCSQASDVPLLTCSEAVERLQVKRRSWAGKQRYLAMYSSVVGGIVTDPAAMVIPLDDHMVHRGHGVFDTAAIMDGHLYELNQHLDRIIRSAFMAKISLPFDRESIRGILIQTVSASQCRKGSLRGVKVVTSSVPIKPPQFATMKSVNYLPNALSKMEAEENSAYAAIWLDNEGFIAEGPNMNVAFVTKEKELLMPHFDKILSGCTAKRVLTIAEALADEGKLLQGIKLGNVTVEEGKAAEEMMLIGSGVLVRSVVQWDEQVIGDGKEGPVTQTLLNAIIEDMKSGPSTVRTPVPY
ncbi:hypothetical protein BT93_C1749 [Corymbia citriodora subsp. variegata]|nr:hypothetical protein BT93_C1749 [Corymbia citriodora subsp. variegata]